MSNTKSPEEINQFRERIIKEAENLLLNKFPLTIDELDKLLDEKCSMKNLSKIHSDVNIPLPEELESIDYKEAHLRKRKRNDSEGDHHVMGTKVYALPNGISPSNKHIIKLIDLVKPKIRQLIEDTNLLKMWIIFLIPRIEDGNNFGVSIQEETLGEIRTVEVESGAYFDQVSKYFLSRAKIVSKIAKYPHIEDFRRSVEEIDEKEYLSLRIVIAELRNHYATLYDIITKNLEKIRRPRNSNTEAMF